MRHDDGWLWCDKGGESKAGFPGAQPQTAAEWCNKAGFVLPGFAAWQTPHYVAALRNDCVFLVEKLSNDHHAVEL
jgi:hypothetical protein